MYSYLELGYDFQVTQLPYAVSMLFVLFSGCLEGEFQCNQTVCIDILRRCDRTIDCDDGRDEEDCGTFVCLFPFTFP